MAIIEHVDVLPIEFHGAAVERLRHSMQLRRQADLEEMRALAELAAEHSWTTLDELDVVGERATRIGADGTPLIGEYLRSRSPPSRESPSPPQPG